MIDPSVRFIDFLFFKKFRKRLGGFSKVYGYALNLLQTANRLHNIFTCMLPELSMICKKTNLHEGSLR